jgi:hypothetical protein
MARTKSRYFDAGVRIECVRRAVEASEWLDVGRWEATGPHTHWPDFPDVTAALADELSALERPRERPGERPRGGLTVFFVCGMDHHERCSPAAAIAHQPALSAAARAVELGVMVISREGRAAKRSPAIPNRAVQVLAADGSVEDQDVSSTRVRELIAALEKGLSVTGDGSFVHIVHELNHLLNEGTTSYILEKLGMPPMQQLQSPASPQLSADRGNDGRATRGGSLNADVAGPEPSATAEKVGMSPVRAKTWPAMSHGSECPTELAQHAQLHQRSGPPQPQPAAQVGPQATSYEEDRGPGPMGMCTMYPAMNSDGTHV